MSPLVIFAAAVGAHHTLPHEFPVRAGFVSGRPWRCAARAFDVWRARIVVGKGAGRVAQSPLLLMPLKAQGCKDHPSPAGNPPEPLRGYAACQQERPLTSFYRPLRSRTLESWRRPGCELQGHKVNRGCVFSRWCTDSEPNRRRRFSCLSADLRVDRFRTVLTFSLHVSTGKDQIER
jgi:hypothetical protein